MVDSAANIGMTDEVERKGDDMTQGTMRRNLRVLGAAMVAAGLLGCGPVALLNPPAGAPPPAAQARPFPTLAPELPRSGRPLMTPAEVAAREQALMAVGARARAEGGQITGATRD